MTLRTRFKEKVHRFSLSAGLTLLSAAPALAQTRADDYGGGAGIDIMSGRSWAAYFIGGFLLLILLLAIHASQKKKQRDREQARIHHEHMEKLKAERHAAIEQAKKEHEAH